MVKTTHELILSKRVEMEAKKVEIEAKELEIGLVALRDELGVKGEELRALCHQYSQEDDEP